MVLATLTVVQVALLWHGRDLALAAAESGVQAARAYGGSNADGERQARDYLHAVDPTLLPAAQIHATRTATTVHVRIHAHVLAVAGTPLTFTIDEQAQAPLERFVSGHV